MQRDNDLLETYKKGINIDSLFVINATGIKTERDILTIQYDRKNLISIINDFNDLSVENIRAKYKLSKDGRDWKVKNAKNDIENNTPRILEVLYRPFDYRFTAYTGNTKGFMAYPRHNIMQHLLYSNLALITTRINRGLSKGYVFLTNNLLDLHLLDSAGDSLQTYPLYLYSEDGTKIPNLKKEIVEEIENKVGKVSPEEILDYIYAVLYSPSYREKYKEFLKIDFPRVPFPKDKESFKKLVKIGTELRSLHLLESPKVNQFITTYSVAGENEVEKVRFETLKQVQGEHGKVYINKEQYFGKVPEIAWNFYIGGYQPAQKWLKDRKGRTLTNSDIEHYQKDYCCPFRN